MTARPGWHASPVATRWFRRRWNEARGDSSDSWGQAICYFETGDDGRPTRQVEVYDAGPTLRYGPGHEEDGYGFLSREKLDVDGDWTPCEIAKEDFDAVWGLSS